jgi:hypothetical protein
LKEVFFRNMTSIMTEGSNITSKRSMPILQLLTVVAHLDNFAVIVPGSAGYYASHLLYSISSSIGRLAGYKQWYEEYTPSRLHVVAAAGAGKMAAA